VQLGVFNNVANAEELRAKLELNGIPSQIEARVQVGPFGSRQEAEEARQKLSGLGLEPGDLRDTLLVALLGIAVLVLLIGCANAAHLVMVRGLDRLGKFAVMRALGASRQRIAGEFLTEVVLIAAVALVFSLVLSLAGISAFVGLIDSGLPRAASIGLTPAVVGFALINALLVILVCGAWPTWRMLRSDIHGDLRRRVGLAPGAATIERGLPVAAIALSLAALSTATLLALSAHRLASRGPGGSGGRAPAGARATLEARAPPPIWTKRRSKGTALAASS